MTTASEPPGWYRDPTGQGDARYWNGASWTEAVVREGRQSNVPIDPATAQQSPLPGTQVQLPPIAADNDRDSGSTGSSGGVIIALVIALLLIVVVVWEVSSGDSSVDSPPPDTEVAPATEAPTPTEPAAGDE